MNGNVAGSVTWKNAFTGVAPRHAAARSFFKPEFFPSPALVLATGVEMVKSHELFEHINISMQRILAGFFAGSAIAAPIGLLMGSIRRVRVIFDPYTQFFRFVPSIAWLTPVVLWFGVGEFSKVLIIVYTTIFIVLINTMVGVANIAPNEAGRNDVPQHDHAGDRGEVEQMLALELAAQSGEWRPRSVER
jgi:NitT/TauT family transport system permease protein